MIKLGLTKNDLKRGELVTVGDGDGQQYVVLEVIQLEDGTEQQVAVVAPEYNMDEEEVGEIHWKSLQGLTKPKLSSWQYKKSHREYFVNRAVCCLGFTNFT